MLGLDVLSAIMALCRRFTWEQASCCAWAWPACSAIAIWLSATVEKRGHFVFCLCRGFFVQVTYTTSLSRPTFTFTFLQASHSNFTDVRTFICQPSMCLLTLAFVIFHWNERRIKLAPNVYVSSIETGICIWDCKYISFRHPICHGHGHGTRHGHHANSPCIMHDVNCEKQRSSREPTSTRSSQCNARLGWYRRLETSYSDRLHSSCFESNSSPMGTANVVMTWIAFL